MKKAFMLIGLLLVFVMLGACREKTATGETTQPVITTISQEPQASTTGTEQQSTEQTSSTTLSQDESTTTTIDVNADEDEFVQTGTDEQDVTLGVTSSDPSTIVVDYGDLVTLNLYSERLKSTEVYNEDLLVDTTINRAESATLTIQANEKGYFNIIDKNTAETLFRFIVAEQTLKGSQED